jgi:hypothetical protein
LDSAPSCSVVGVAAEVVAAGAEEAVAVAGAEEAVAEVAEVAEEEGSSRPCMKRHASATEALPVDA